MVISTPDCVFEADLAVSSDSSRPRFSYIQPERIKLIDLPDGPLPRSPEGRSTASPRNAPALTRSSVGGEV